MIALPRRRATAEAVRVLQARTAREGVVVKRYKLVVADGHAYALRVK